jgi:hypothetical protein
MKMEPVKKKKIAKAAAAKSLGVHLPGRRTGTIKNPLATWQLFASGDPTSQPQTIIVCSKCHTRCVGGMMMTLGVQPPEHPWFCQCKCKGSSKQIVNHRSAGNPAKYCPSGLPGAFWSEGPTWKELLQRK